MEVLGNFSKRPRRCEDLAMDTTTTEKGDTINNDDFLMRDWEQKELRNIDQLKKERTALCERFAKAETWDKKYRLILDFAARQDSPRSRKKRLNETVLTCIPEAEMPPPLQGLLRRTARCRAVAFYSGRSFSSFPKRPYTNSRWIYSRHNISRASRTGQVGA